MKPADLPASIHRVGRLPNPFAWPDWAYADPDGTFGNRFDDPRGTYRVLYAATGREGAYIETLALFRPDPAVFAALDAIEGEPDEVDLPRGVVPKQWFVPRAMGTGVLSGSFVDLGAAATLAELRTKLASRLLHHGIADLDASAIRLSVPRGFTQDISRVVYEVTAPDGHRAWDGIAYSSRLGDDLHNWATFEPNDPGEQQVEPLDRADPTLASALAILALELEDED